MGLITAVVNSFTKSGASNELSEEAKGVLESRITLVRDDCKEKFRQRVFQLKNSILRGLGSPEQANEIHLEYFKTIAQGLREVFVNVYQEDGEILNENDVPEIASRILLEINNAIRETDISVSSQIESGGARQRL